MKLAFSPTKVQALRALNDNVLVVDMPFEERITTGGILLPSDNGKGTGIRPRWARVYAIGPAHVDVKPGQWICVSHGRWTRGIEIEDAQGTKTLRKIDPKDILLVSDDRPADDTMSDAIHIDQKKL